MTYESRLVGTSPFAKKVARAVTKLAAGKDDVLIIGEVGSGRRTIANEIHNARGKKKQYHVIDARAAYDEEVRATLLSEQSEVAEAVSGRKSAGIQDGGTLVIADAELLAPHNQELVVRFFRDGKKRYGNAKVIVTLQRPLEQLAQGGELIPEIVPFLEKCELIEVPALRERVEDVAALAHGIAARLCSSFGVPMKTIDPNTSHILSQGQWPGNIQQLVGVVGKAVLVSKGEKLELPEDFLDEHQHLEDAITNIASAKVFILDTSLDLIEKLLIQRALKRFLYNQSKTASIFGLSEANFRYRLKKFGLPSIRKKV